MRTTNYGGWNMQVTNGLYTIRNEMKDGKLGRATGVVKFVGATLTSFTLARTRSGTANGGVKSSHASTPKPWVRT